MTGNLQIVSVVFCALAACSGSGNERATSGSEQAERTSAQEDRSADEPDRPAVDPESSCGHALACCRAYANAMPNVVERSACEGVYEALELPDPDARCGAMTVGWRDALVHLTANAPAECE